MKIQRNGKYDRGVILIAHNTEHCDYLSQAVYSAERVNRFLDLPVTLITDSETSESLEADKKFHDVIIVKKPGFNSLKGKPWLNLGRASAYKLSPYRQTLLLDTDYNINSDSLLSSHWWGEMCCWNRISWIGGPTETEVDKLGSTPYQTCWATVLSWTRGEFAEAVFDVWSRVLANPEHYSTIYRYPVSPLRNDYALTVALKAVSGGISNIQHHAPGVLHHVHQNCEIIRLDDTRYKIQWAEDNRKFWIEVSDMDFHVLNKDAFRSII